MPVAAALQSAPPDTEQDLIDRVRLIRSRRVGPGTFIRLIGEHGSAARALAALPAIARDAGVKEYQTCPEGVAQAEIRAARQAGAVALLLGQEGYPDLLSGIADPPPLIWGLGDTTLLNRPAIGIVGARSASSLGTRMAERLATDLGAKGHVIISGLARGIDTAAHKGALKTGTIAIMPGGVDVVYPKENAVLAQEIQQSGLRLSEQPPGTLPQARHFAQRNRLISGLARALVVVEAAAKSGSLITARAAGEQGRDVMAVPGHPFDARAAGCNMLIRDGAVLVRGAADVIEALANEPAKSAATEHQPEENAAHDLAEKESDRHLQLQILGMIAPAPITEDQVIRNLSLPASVVSPAIARMEVDGKVLRCAGGVIRRV